MARNLMFYSQATHSVVVNGRPLLDFAEGDSITWEDLNADKVAVTEGLDGGRISYSASKAGKITVKLKPTSASIDYLNYLIERQQAGVPEPLTVCIFTGVYEVVTLINAGVQRGSASTGGPTMAEREYSFVGCAIAIVA